MKRVIQSGLVTRHFTRFEEVTITNLCALASFKVVRVHIEMTDRNEAKNAFLMHLLCGVRVCAMRT